MRNDPAAKSRARTVESSVGFHASTDWIMAALFLIAAVAAAVYLPAPLVFDTNSPDFGPFGFLPLILCAGALRYAVPALRGMIRSRRFGSATMELDSWTTAPGGTLKGVIRVPGSLAPLGDYEFLLQCVEQREEYDTVRNTTRLKDHVRGEQTLRVSREGVHAEDGVPFSFVIPTGALTTSSGDLMNSQSVRWLLEVKAPLKGMNFYGIYGVEIRA